eukprot:285451_1
MTSFNSNAFPEFAAATSHGRLPELMDEFETPYDDKDETQQKYDSYHLIKGVMFLIGIGAVFPLNALLLCSSYYRQEYSEHMIYYIIPIYSIAYIIFLLILTRCGVSKFSFASRIIISFLLCAITFFSLVQFTNHNPWDSYLLSLIVFIIGMTSSIVNRSLLGFTNILEPSYKRALISGEELSGIIASIIRVITRLCYGNDPVGSANTYFIFIMSYCVLCAVLFATIRFTDYVMIRLNIYVLYMARYKKSTSVRKSFFSPYTQAQKAHTQHHDSESNTKQTDRSTSNERMSEEQYQRISIDDDYQIKPRSLSVANASARSLSLQNDTSDMNDYMSSFQYKPNHTAALPVINTSVAPLTNTRNHNYKSTKKRYSSLLFDDTSSKSFWFYKSFSRKLKLYCLIMLLANALSWSIVPGMIAGKMQSDWTFIQRNDWLSILLMSEYFISNYFGRLVMSSPSFWWCCCEYNEHNNVKRVVVRNLGCCPICCGRGSVTIATTFLLWLCMCRIVLLYPMFMMIYLKVYDINWIAHLVMIGTGITQGYIYHMAFELA